MRRGVFLIVLIPAFALADAYRWSDEQGVVHYSDSLPPASARNIQKKRLTGNSIAAQERYDLTVASRDFPATLYSHPVCKEECARARKVLNDRGVPFKEISAVDVDAMDSVRRLTGSTGVPVLVVGSIVENGFDESAYQRALDLAGYPPPGAAKSPNPSALEKIDGKRPQ